MRNAINNQVPGKVATAVDSENKSPLGGMFPFPIVSGSKNTVTYSNDKIVLITATYTNHVATFSVSTRLDFYIYHIKTLQCNNKNLRFNN